MVQFDMRRGSEKGVSLVHPLSPLAFPGLFTPYSGPFPLILRPFALEGVPRARRHGPENWDLVAFSWRFPSYLPGKGLRGWTFTRQD